LRFSGDGNAEDVDDFVVINRKNWAIECAKRSQSKGEFMFQQVVSQLTGSTDSIAYLSPSAPLMGQVLFDSICVRLDRDLPRGPYLSDKKFAEILGVAMKTLANNRSVKPERYPKPLKLCDCREGKHVRSEIIEWLAREEFKARTQIIHRCQ
jgi:predicted DNA-binding transcriptional regulator AlpA